MEKRIIRSLARRIEKNSMPVTETGCHIWLKYLNKCGYGSIGWREGKKCPTMLAHRAAWLVHRGSIPVGMCVCHSCDNPSCVNIDHLFLGTQRENVEDMDAKGRRKSGLPTLTHAKAMQIRRECGRLVDIAAKHGIAASTVSRIKNGKLWGLVG